MKKINLKHCYALFLLALSHFASCQSVNESKVITFKDSAKTEGLTTDKFSGLSDPTVTTETIALFNNLKKIAKKGIIFGQHDPTFYHQNGKYPLDNNLQSDCYTSVGSHPGIFNFDLNPYIDVSQFKTQVEEIYRRGGIISFSWHAKNPITMSSKIAHDTSGNPVQSILAEGIGWTNWKKELDNVAAYFNSLTVDGVKVPIIFRPFHEHTGNWFWWGAKHCTEKEYVALWKKTVDYLRNAGVNNMLLAYSPSKPSLNLALSLSTFPGDKYVDIIGFDLYDFKSDNLKTLLIDGVKFASNLAKEKNKVAAITEIGVSEGLQNSDTNDWFMSTFLNPLKSSGHYHEIAYVTTWFNLNEKKYWLPLPGQPNYRSFVDFYNDETTFFLNDLPNLYLLKN